MMVGREENSTIDKEDSSLKHMTTINDAVIATPSHIELLISGYENNISVNLVSFSWKLRVFTYMLPSQLKLI